MFRVGREVVKEEEEGGSGPELLQTETSVEGEPERVVHGEGALGIGGVVRKVSRRRPASKRRRCKSRTRSKPRRSPRRRRRAKPRAKPRRPRKNRKRVTAPRRRSLQVST